MDANGPPPRKCTNSIQKVVYGFGHIYNDLCAAMWFSYMLFYLQIVLEMEANTAGILIMIGQVIDSLATPVAGWIVQKTKAPRKCHLAGTLAVAVGFNLIFFMKHNPSLALDYKNLVYYGSFISLFQIGWALVQISHLSILPELSRNHAHSTDLTAIRYTASVCCSICIYVITLLILKNGDNPNKIGPSDFYKFKEIALLVSFIGLLACLFFYCGMLSKPDTPEYEEIASSTPTEDANGLSTDDGNTKSFLKSCLIYYVSFMYMASRLFTTLNLVYIPLYLVERQDNMTDGIVDGEIRQTIASVPLVSFLSSLLTSVLLKYRSRCCNDKITYLIGSGISLMGSIWVGLGVPKYSNTFIYVIASLIGIGGATTMVSSLCLTANFVKTNGYGGASVYSMVTFTDKLISGIIVFTVQNLQCEPKSLCPNYYEQILSYVCMGVAIVGIVSLIGLQCKIKKRSTSY